MRPQGKFYLKPEAGETGKVTIDASFRQSTVNITVHSGGECEISSVPPAQNDGDPPNPVLAQVQFKGNEKINDDDPTSLPTYHYSAASFAAVVATAYHG